MLRLRWENLLENPLKSRTEEEAYIIKTVAESQKNMFLAVARG